MSETNTGGQKVSNPSAKTLVPQPGPQSAPWQIPVAVPPPEYQWPAHFWPAAPWPQAYSQYMTAFLNPLPSVSQTSASNTPLASPRSKDDAVRLVKPKEPQSHPQPSPVEIQSPKPNSPGFSLGAFRKEGYHAFSPYNSRSDTPNRVSNTQPGTPSPAHMGGDKSGVDLTVSKSSSKTSEEKASNNSDSRKDDGRKSTIPVGIAVGRQRSPTANTQSKSGSKIVSEVKSAESVTNSAALVLPTNSVIASADISTAAHQANSTSMSSQWSPYTVPYMANPYHHFTIAHPAMYMVPAGPRGLFPAQPGIAPGYIPLPVMPELTVKTGQTSQTAHASTSPNKPVSADCSPKSPLDKARERLHEMKQKKEFEASSAQGKSQVSEVNQANILKAAASSPEATTSVDASLHTANNQKPEPKPSQCEDESYSMQKNKTQQPKSKNQLDEPKTKRPRGRPKGSVPKDKSSAKTPPLLKDSSNTHSSAAALEAAVQSVKSKKEKASVAKRHRRSETPVQELCEVPKALVIPANIEKQPFLFAEDSLDPVIVKFDSKAYDICQDDDLKLLEGSLRVRLKLLQRRMEEHQQALDKDKEEPSPVKPTPVISEPLERLKSAFSVRSDSHPSLKMKAAAKAKCRAISHSEEKPKEVSDTKPSPITSVRKESTEQVMEPLKPLRIPDVMCDCRKLSKNDLLTMDSIILVNIDGLFYESRIKPIEPPDIYGVIIDGERHSKPRIFTEEDLLHNTFTNVTPQHLTQVNVGTRVCAYWSDMIGCLYPGTVTALYPTTSANAKHLIDIEFDDGDSGKFPLIQIRLLPSNFPHSNYDTSSLLPVGRRRSCAVPETPPIMISPPDKRGRLPQTRFHSPGSSKLSKDSSIKSEPSSTAKGKGCSSTLSECSDLDSFSDVTNISEGTEWQWVGPPTKKQSRGKGMKEFYQSISRDDETINVGDCAVFQSLGSTRLPYIGQILSMWEGWGGKMRVSVKWFYHPQELQVSVKLPKQKGALFESDHSDENCVQTIRHKCSVVPYEEYLKQRSITSTNDKQFYLAGNYDAAKRKVNRLYV